MASKKELKKLAKEMNSLMGLDPEIDLKQSEKDLEAEIKRNIDEIYETDITPENEGDEVFSEESVKTLAELGCQFAADALEAEEEPEEEEPEEEEKPRRRKESAPKEKPAPKKEKPAPKKEKPKAEKTAKEPAAKKVTRIQATAQALTAAAKKKKNHTAEDLIAASNEVYMNNGGKDNPREAKYFYNIIVGALAEMDQLSIDGDNIKFS